MLNFFTKKKGVNTKSSEPSMYSSIESLPSYGFSLPQNIRALYNIYSSSAVLWDAVDQISSNVASLPIAIKDKDSEEIVTNVARYKDLQNLLENPNQFGEHTWADLLYKLTTYYLITGEFNLYVIGNPKKPSSLLPLPPEHIISADFDRAGFVSSYRYQGNGGEITFTRQDGHYFSDGGQLIRATRFNPQNYGRPNAYRGLSLINVLHEQIEQVQLANNHNASLLKNGARPTGALVYDMKDGGNLSEEQIQVLKDSLAEHYQNSLNAGRPLLLQGGLSWQEMAVSMRDMDFIKNLDKNEEIIYKVFGIPLSLKNSKSLTYNNLKEGALFYYKQTVIPALETMLSSLNSQLIRRLYPNIELIVDKGKIDVLNAETEIKVNTFIKSESCTRDEIRALLGLDPLNEGGDVIVSSINSTTEPAEGGDDESGDRTR